MKTYELRAKIRVQAGRKPIPSVGILDSQSVKTTEIGGDERGYDKVKNVEGRKRRLLVDTMGLILVVIVHSAAFQDRAGAKLGFQQLATTFTRLVLIRADGGYTGKLLDWVRGLRTYWRIRIEIVKRNDQQTLPPTEQGLRTIAGHQGNHDLLGDDPPEATQTGI
ncbi:MAG: transposase [Blastocatellales bacterium]